MEERESDRYAADANALIPPDQLDAEQEAARLMDFSSECDLFAGSVV